MPFFVYQNKTLLSHYTHDLHSKLHYLLIRDFLKETIDLTGIISVRHSFKFFFLNQFDYIKCLFSFLNNLKIVNGNTYTNAFKCN